ncbi:16888_t:CDS:2, partial [Cetraspora pellucida]
MNNQVCNATKTTPYQLVFRQDLQADLQLITMLYQQNIIKEENISLENQAPTDQSNLIINNYQNNMNMIIINDNNDTSDLESNISNKDKMLISRENSFMNTDVDYEVIDLTYEDSLFEDSSQASCSYTLIEKSDQEGYSSTEDSNKESQKSIKSQSHAYLDYHKPICDIAKHYIEKNRQIIFLDIDKLKLDRHSLPCKIIQKKPNLDSYQVGYEFGILDLWFLANELEPLVQGVEDDPFIQSQTNNQAKEMKSKKNDSCH